MWDNSRYSVYSVWLNQGLEKVYMLFGMKKQFAELLYELNFISSSNSKERSCNVNSDNEGLIKAVICAGLYPNVAKISVSFAKKQSAVKLRTKSQQRCELHKKSVLASMFNEDSKWVVYYMQMKTSALFLWDATLVSPYPLLFFGGQIGMETVEGHQFVTVDDWIKFKASADTVQRVQNLRQELDSLLEEKILHPGPTAWDPQHKEGAILRAIIMLVTMEEQESKYRQFERD